MEVLLKGSKGRRVGGGGNRGDRGLSPSSLALSITKLLNILQLQSLWS